ncbi:hypothetical protein EKN06_12850 [Croceicoccus ponticola]|uniref:Uncharacterized protein n=1 Tax=Croceicoccus ponticola TaxID=2217664 RepID=A0A437GVP1_9SPHN|nr:hypothetical protein EKN06_12850 [Croceicoccus ponticola]
MAMQSGNHAKMVWARQICVRQSSDVDICGQVIDRDQGIAMIAILHDKHARYGTPAGDYKPHQKGTAYEMGILDIRIALCSGDDAFPD